MSCQYIFCLTLIQAHISIDIQCCLILGSFTSFDEIYNKVFIRFFTLMKTNEMNKNNMRLKCSNLQKCVYHKTYIVILKFPLRKLA
jgi:hypothetical protein